MIINERVNTKFKNLSANNNKTFLVNICISDKISGDYLRSIGDV